MTVVFKSKRSAASCRTKAPCKMQGGIGSLHAHDLVPLSQATLSCLVDLGLSNEEIERYLSRDRTHVGRIAANLHAMIVKDEEMLL